MFMTLMVVGLLGLLAMALPAFAGSRSHGALARGGAHAKIFARGGAHAGALARGAHGLKGVAQSKLAAVSTRGGSQDLIPADIERPSHLWFIPSPRAICSVLALYGAFGNALVNAIHLPFVASALLAAVPALLVERFAVRPVWNLVFRFQGEPSSPLEHLVMSDARAVVPFRNGRGLVSVVRDGRRVQFVATLRDDQRDAAVKVGARLVIEDVDAKRESVTVSLVTDV
ncbi:MAG: hypothetical protein ACRELY_00440 [Polyangiaceae bacterium]